MFVQKLQLVSSEGELLLMRMKSFLKIRIILFIYILYIILFIRNHSLFNFCIMTEAGDYINPQHFSQHPVFPLRPVPGPVCSEATCQQVRPWAILLMHHCYIPSLSPQVSFLHMFMCVCLLRRV